MIQGRINKPTLVEKMSARNRQLETKAEAARPLKWTQVHSAESLNKSPKRGKVRWLENNSVDTGTSVSPVAASGEPPAYLAVHQTRIVSAE